jgi:hypothetical protein
MSLKYSASFQEVNNLCSDHGRLYVIIIIRRSIMSVRGAWFVLISMDIALQFCMPVNKYNHVNKNVDIKFSMHDAFLEWLSSGTLKIKRFESQII